MLLEKFIDEMRPEIEGELHWAVDTLLEGVPEEARLMLNYHMGWVGEGAGSESQGKRIRPLMVLLCTATAGGDWRKALPAAAAVELVHNFSLIHDDIQDQSPMRRGRPTVWVKWGIPQAINAGDMLFTLAHMTIYQLCKFLPAPVILDAANLLDQTCLSLTVGQHLDISYENRTDLKLVDYWPMVGGKTAALLGCCTQLGAMVAGVDQTRQQAFHHFGVTLGLAFQAFDDGLGIWGDAALTGKSTESDLVSGKKSLPVLYALENSERFSRRWAKGPINSDEVVDISRWMAEDGAQEFTLQTANRLTGEALESLRDAADDSDAVNALRELAAVLLKRNN